MAIALKLGTNGQLSQIQAGDSVQADSFERLSGSGNLIVGSGITTAELRLGTTSNIVRTMNDLASDGALTVVDEVTLSSVLSPAQITANQDNYAPSGIGDAFHLRINSDAARNVTGISASQTQGRLLTVTNTGSFIITLINDATSTAANRFLLRSDYPLAPDNSVNLIYDGTTSRWRLVSPARIPIREAVTTEAIAASDTAMTDTLDIAPISIASVMLFFNGVLQRQGAGADYTLGGTGNRTITWLSSTGTAEPMNTSDRMDAFYWV